MLRCIGNNILVKDVKSESKEVCEKIGNLIVPTKEPEYDMVQVLSVGEELVDKISENDTLLIITGSGKKIHFGGEEYRAINVSSIIAVV